MIKQIIESHNGTIHAESDGSGKGTTFFLLLPNGAEKLNNTKLQKE
jgi:signal transduction histidine kinase